MLWTPNGLDKLLQVLFDFPFILEGKATMIS